MSIKYRFIINILSIISGTIGVTMLIPAAVDFYYQNSNGSVFLLSSVFTMVISTLSYVSTKTHDSETLSVSLKDGTLLTVIAWFVIVAFAAIPFKYSTIAMSYTDAYFEAMSAITTTGASVIPDLNKLTPGLHLWRGLLQWLGGLGIIVTSIALLPKLRIGGMGLFKVEAFDTFNLSISRAAKIASGIIAIYLVSSLAIFLGLAIIAKLNIFDALIHAMTTVSTAGFSTQNGSVGDLNNPIAEVIIIIGMIVGGLPFILVYYLLFSNNKSVFFKDQQIGGYIVTLISIVAVVTLLISHVEGERLTTALRESAFTMTSIMTGTGFVSVNYGEWHSILLVVVFFTMFIGGCSGSSACGMKIFRFQIAFSLIKAELKKIISPYSVNVPMYNGKQLDQGTISSVFSYFTLFIASFIILSIIIGLNHIDVMSALTLSATSLTNVGPAFGNLASPDVSLYWLPDNVKWSMIVGMIIGRLEVIGFFALLHNKFWAS